MVPLSPHVTASYGDTLTDDSDDDTSEHDANNNRDNYDDWSDYDSTTGAAHIHWSPTQQSLGAASSLDGDVTVSDESGDSDGDEEDVGSDATCSW